MVLDFSEIQLEVDCDVMEWATEAQKVRDIYQSKVERLKEIS
jgi:hypothetical protein